MTARHPLALLCIPAAGFSANAMAQAEASHLPGDSAGGKPIIVLVRGAFADSWSWDGVIGAHAATPTTIP